MLRLAGKVLFVFFAEIRWTVIIVKEAALHPLSESYVNVKTGKVVARYLASGQGETEIRETGQGGINWPIAFCLVLILAGVAIKIWTWWLG